MTVLEVCKIFQIQGKHKNTEVLKSGNINDTYKVTFIREGLDKDYIIQRINSVVFNNPEHIMQNIEAVTSHIRKKIKDEGKSAKRSVLHYLHTNDERNFFVDESGNFWRGYRFIENSITYDISDNLTVLEHAGKAFGHFQMMLADFSAAKLFEIIPDFHNTKRRLEKLFIDVETDKYGRASDVEEEINFFRDTCEISTKLNKLLEDGEIFLRVTHNDTKCNNVLFDKDTHEPLTVIDLDTVMPGLVMHDFGDAVRFAANTSTEDEKDLSKVSFDLKRFEAFTKGFMGEVRHSLTKIEIENMALGAITLAIELGSRFLDDYITGDKYFKTSYEGHNLVRARCQIALAKDMMEKFDVMKEIVTKYI